LFSSAGYTVNKIRSTLDPHTVNMLVCLRDCCRWRELSIHVTLNCMAYLCKKFE